MELSSSYITITVQKHTKGQIHSYLGIITYTLLAQHHYFIIKQKHFQSNHYMVLSILNNANQACLKF